VGSGVVGEIATGFPGYDSIIPIDKGTIGTILKENGYATSWFGKDHNTPAYQSSQAGPFDQWPNGMGFEYFYGFVGGDASQWQPNLFRNTTAIYPFLDNPGWNLETAMADEAIQYMKQLKEIAPGKPWFVYYVPGATHAPHHPTEEWVKKISDMHLFDDGWNKVRETIFANQKRLGIMPENAQLTPWPKGLPEWDSLSWDEKKLFIKQADVYGAYLAYADNEIGRVIQAVEDLGELDNTLIIYIGGDNGASAEGMLNGTPNEFTKKRREAPAFMPGMDRRWARRAQCPRAQQDPRSARALNGRGNGRGGSPGIHAGEDVPEMCARSTVHGKAARSPSPGCLPGPADGQDSHRGIAGDGCQDSVTGKRVCTANHASQ